MPETLIHHSDLDDDSRNILAYYGCITLNPVDETAKEAFWHTPKDYSREKVIALLSGNDELREWIDNRVELFQPLQVEMGSIHHYDAKKIFNKADESLIKVLHEDWPLYLKKYALKNLLHLYHVEQVDTPDDFRERLDFVEHFVSREVINEGDYDVTSLLSGRLTFLRAMQLYLSDEDIKGAFLDPKIRMHLRHLETRSGWFIAIQEEGDYEGYKKRESAPVDFEDGMENKAEEIIDVLDHSGLGEIARLLAKKIRAVHPQTSDTIRGSLGRTYGEYPRAGEIHIAIGENSRKELLYVLIHELGHALQDRTLRSPRYYEWSNRYAILTCTTGETRHSPYAVSYLYDNKVKNSYPSGGYITESFAEDFNLYLLVPERLQDERKQIFDEICAEIFPDIDLDELRRGISSTLGEFYGASVEDIIRPLDHEHSKDLKRSRDRVESENKRDEVRKIIDGMTHKEMLYWINRIPENEYRLSDLKDVPKRIESLYYRVGSGEYDQDLVLREITRGLQKEDIT